MSRTILIALTLGVTAMLTATTVAQELTYVQQGSAAYQAAEKLRAEQKYEEAAAAYEAMVNDFANHEYTDDAIYLCGYVYSKQLQQQDKAAAILELGMQKYPHGSHITYIMSDLAGVYVQQGEHAKAAELYTDVANVARGTSSEESYRFNAAQQYRAIKSADKLVQTVSDYVEAFGFKGTRGLDLLLIQAQLQLELDDIEGCTATAAQLEETAPRSQQLGTLYYYIASAMREKKNYEQSTLYWTKASQVADYSNAHSMLWYAAYDVTQYGQPPHHDKVIAIYRQYMEQFPKGPYREQALLNIADQHQSSNDQAARIEVLQEFRKTFPDSTQSDKAMHQLAMSLQQTKQDDLAIQMYKDLIADYPQSEFVDDALVSLANMYASTGFPELAKPLYTTLVDEHPGTYAADAATRALASMP